MAVGQVIHLPSLMEKGRSSTCPTNLVQDVGFGLRILHGLSCLTAALVNISGEHVHHLIDGHVRRIHPDGGVSLQK